MELRERLLKILTIIWNDKFLRHKILCYILNELNEITGRILL